VFTNQKVLGLILILFIIGTSVYFAVNKFKNDTAISPSPSPTPASLDFNFNPQPALTQNQQTAAAQGQKTQQQPQATGLPLEKNKRLAQFPGILKPEILQNSAGGSSKAVVVQTTKGQIAIQIYPEASMAASNFMILAANGFYNGLKFHRVESGFVVQGGDPNGDGTGGPGYQFPDEPVTREYLKGTVAMANAGPNTNGSQFFIMLADHPELPKQYTIFGQVIAGQDVVDKLAVGDTIQKAIVQNLQ